MTKEYEDAILQKNLQKFQKYNSALPNTSIYLILESERLKTLELIIKYSLIFFSYLLCWKACLLDL